MPAADTRGSLASRACLLPPPAPVPGSSSGSSPGTEVRTRRVEQTGRNRPPNRQTDRLQIIKRPSAGRRRTTDRPPTDRRQTTDGPLIDLSYRSPKDHRRATDGWSTLPQPAHIVTKQSDICTYHRSYLQLHNYTYRYTDQRQPARPGQTQGAAGTKTMVPTRLCKTLHESTHSTQPGNDRTRRLYRRRSGKSTREESISSCSGHHVVRYL